MESEGPVLPCLKAPDHVCVMPTNGGLLVADGEEPDQKDVVGVVERARNDDIHDLHALGHVSLDGPAVAREERVDGGGRVGGGSGGGRGICGGSADGVRCGEQQEQRRDEESVEHRVNEDEEVKMERGSEADEDSVSRFFSDSRAGSFIIDQESLLRREDRYKVLMTSIDVEPTQYGHQVGGHETTGTVTKQTNILRVGDKYVLKAVQDKGRGERELLIYQMLFPESATSDSCSSRVEADLHPHLRELRAFLPRLRGVKEVNGGRYMVLEDLCHDVGPNPSIMDIKIGQVTTAVDAPPEKVQREASKYAYQRQMGFRIVGMKVYDCESGTYRVHGKELGYGLTPEQVPGALASFFLRKRRPSSSTSMSSTEQQHHLHAFVHRLEALLAWFEAQDLLIFRGSSLLFVDGQETDRYDLRMIDLAHVHKIEDVRERVPSCRDDGYIHGLKTLISILKGLLL